MDIATFLSKKYTLQDPQVIGDSKYELTKVPFPIAQIAGFNKDINKLTDISLYNHFRCADEWLRANCQGKYYPLRSGWFYAFAKDEDAILFTLRWG